MNHSCRNNWSRRLLLVLGSLALLQCSKAHADAATLSSGSFVNGTNFQFNLNTIISTNWNIMASSNLTFWTSIGTLTTTGSPATFVETNAARFSPRFYRANVGSEYSDSIGYIRVIVPGRTNPTNDATGLAMIANQLNNEAGSNTLSVLMPVVPDGTSITKYDASSQSFESPSVYSVIDGGWTPSAAATLNPGEGAFVQNSTTNDLTITFIGKVPTGTLSLTIYPGNNLISPIVPQGAGWNNIDFPAVDSDVVTRFNLQTQNYDTTSMQYFGAPDNFWFPEFFVKPGDAYFVNSAALTNRVWTRTFSVAP